MHLRLFQSSVWHFELSNHIVLSGDLDQSLWHWCLVHQVSFNVLILQWNVVFTRWQRRAQKECVTQLRSQLNLLLCPSCWRIAVKTACQEQRSQLRSQGKRETHLCLHDRTGLRDPKEAAVPSVLVSAVPSEAVANLFPV